MGYNSCVVLLVGASTAVRLTVDHHHQQHRLASPTTIPTRARIRSPVYAGEPLVKDFNENHTDTRVHFTVTTTPAASKLMATCMQADGSGADELSSAVKKVFKLETSITTANMHAFDAAGTIRRYNKVRLVVLCWCPWHEHRWIVCFSPSPPTPHMPPLSHVPPRNATVAAAALRADRGVLHPALVLLREAEGTPAGQDWRRDGETVQQGERAFHDALMRC